MKQFEIIEEKKAVPSDVASADTAGFTAGEHGEAVAFVDKHRDFFEHYAMGAIQVEPAPATLPTFGFDLEKNTIFINSMFFQKKGFSEEKTVFATLHEIEHFLEKLQILSEDGGERVFQRMLGRIKASRAFALMDNCVADVRENRSVVSRTNPGMAELEGEMYKKDLFPDLDFTSQPRHIQFSHAFLREARLPQEPCRVSPEVRQSLDEVAAVPYLTEIMTNPDTPMSTRLKLQDKFIWPKVQSLLDKDVDERKKKDRGDKGQQDGAEGNTGDAQNKVGDKSGEQNREKTSAKSGKAKGRKTTQEPEGTKERTTQEDDARKESDPNAIFAKDYDEAEKRFPNAVPLTEIEKAYHAWKEAQQKKNSDDRADEDYAKKIGVEKEDLQKYRKLVADVEKLVNPETSVSVLEELRRLFRRIISKRFKAALMPRYPVEEGDELVDPAQLVAEVKSGNLQPKVWEDAEIKHKKGERFGEVEATLVCDRSGSMDGLKAEEQRKCAVLMMEALQEFSDVCLAEKMQIDKPMEVRSEVYSFGAGYDDRVPLKKMSNELGEAERINVLKTLYAIGGTTTDFNCLEAIDTNIDTAIQKKMQSGELKKIVIVFTDGRSDSPPKVQGVLQSLRERGVVVIGVGITKEGESVLTTYAPNARVAEETQKLPLVLSDLLKEHLKDV